MKIKLLIILWIVLPLLAYSQVKPEDFNQGTKITFSHFFEVSFLKGQDETFYYLMDNYVKITSLKKYKLLKVEFENAEVKKISDSIYCIIPKKIGNSRLKINDDSKNYIVRKLPLEKVEFKFSASTSRCDDCITIDDLNKSNQIVATFNYNKFKIKEYYIGFYNENTQLVNGENCIDTIPEKFRKKLKENLELNDLVTIVISYYYYDSLVTAPMIGFNVVDSYQNEYLRKNMRLSGLNNDFDLMKNDLRIKIDGQLPKEDLKAVNDLVNELNGILQTIKLKIVDKQPSLTIIIDTLKHKFPDTAKIARLITDGYKRYLDCFIKEINDDFFPFNKQYIVYTESEMFVGIQNEKNKLIAQNTLLSIIVNLLFNFNFQVKSYILDTHDKYSEIRKFTLSDNDKYLLKTLYSPGGEEKVQTIINPDYKEKQKTPAYFLLVILTVCLLFVFSELYNYYGIGNIIRKVKFKIIKRMIEAVLVAQIPIVAWLVLTFSNSGAAKLFADVPYLESRLLPFCLLIALFLFFIDKLLEKTKIVWLNIILNLSLSFLSVVLAYQLMYFFKAPEIIKFSMLGWELWIVPFLITLYRLYARFQTNKIAGLLQEKELELSKQKELKFKSDLNALQARINPHFLYNALNSLASLTYIDQKRTEKMALSLSKLFRYNINKNEEHLATLKDEIEMADIYLQIEKNRFEDKLTYSIELQEQLHDFVIPRFILQPLAENAVKHGISKITGQGIIKIKIFEEANKVIIEIYDNGPEFPGGLISGYGLQNTYEKLKLLYKKAFDISFINAPEKKLVITLTKY